MCKEHNKVFGKEAVIAFAFARIAGDACARRLAYLKDQAMSYLAWLEEQDWCRNPVTYCQNLVEQVEAEYTDRDSETCADYLFDSKVVEPSEQMELEFDAFEELAQDIDDRAARKQYSKPVTIVELEANIERWKTELKLHDRIQDALDVMEPRQYKVFNARLDELKRQNKLSYSGWVTFKNVLRANMGWKPMNTKYVVSCVADQVAKAEAKLETLTREYLDREEFFSDPHPEADAWLEKRDEQALQAGLAEWQQAYLCPMCGVEWIPGSKGCTCK